MATSGTLPSEVFERLACLGEPTRGRLVHVLEQQELTVSELCAVLQAPQSTVSRHLKALADSGWVTSRPEGTRRFYRVDGPSLPPSMRRLWQAVRGDVAASPGAEQDRVRLSAVLGQRRTRSKEFFRSEAGQWDRMRDELFGAGFYLGGLPGLLEDSWIVGDLGCGTGAVSASLAPFVRRIIAVDASGPMLAEARRRLSHHANVDLRQGDLESLPIEDRQLDRAVLHLVLHHLPDPARVLGEVARVLRPGGAVLVVDMMPHDREDLAGRMGHVWLGFSVRAITSYLEEAGFENVRHVPLPADPASRGPTLFAASAKRKDTSENASFQENSP
jgi:ArsR family transcriptional regulator